MAALSRFTLYETATRYYLVGTNHAEERFRVLKIDRAAGPTAHATADPTEYSKTEMAALLQMAAHGNARAGGLRRVLACFGVLGLIRFLGGFYMLLVTRRSVVAEIGGHYIYHIDDTALVSLQPQHPGSTGLLGRASAALRRLGRSADDALPESTAPDTNAEPTLAGADPREQQYIQMLRAMDFTKNFYYSYTYNLSQTLQRNLDGERAWDSKFAWNWFLLQNALASNVPPEWTVPVIYGVVDQAKIAVLASAQYLVTLVGRRSRFMAGTRFLRRGVDADGHVANEVETEQIVHDASATGFRAADGTIRAAFTSFVLHRGSIPLYWAQEPVGIAPKPAIAIQLVDPYFAATQKHFWELRARYGSPIVVLDLVKQHERTPHESLLQREYAAAIAFLNQQSGPHIEHVMWDMARASKSADEDVLDTLSRIAERRVARVGFFHSGPRGRRQNGVVRVNCIDCLDRTNAAQFMVSVCALAHQLYALGAIAEPKLPFACDAVELCKRMFQDHGDTIALQYGGSNLVNTMETYGKNPHWTSHSRDMIESVRRFYSNSFTDADKQDSISLLLGIFRPYEHREMLWDLAPAVRFRARRAGLSDADIPAVFAAADPSATEAGFYERYYLPEKLTSLESLFPFNVMTTASGARRRPGIAPTSPFADASSVSEAPRQRHVAAAPPEPVSALEPLCGEPRPASPASLAVFEASCTLQRADFAPAPPVGLVDPDVPSTVTRQQLVELLQVPNGQDPPLPAYLQASMSQETLADRLVFTQHILCPERALTAPVSTGASSHDEAAFNAHLASGSLDAWVPARPAPNAAGYGAWLSTGQFSLR